MNKQINEDIMELWQCYEAISNYITDIESVILKKNKRLHSTFNNIQVISEVISSHYKDFNEVDSLDYNKINEINESIISELNEKGLDVKSGKILINKKNMTEDDFGEQFHKLIEEIRVSDRHKMFLYNNAIVNIVTEYETFMGCIYKNILLNNPSIIKDKSLSLEELNSCKTIKDAIDYLIYKKTVELFYLSIDKWHESICKEVSIKNDFFKEKKVKIIELFQRRNIIVHNNAKVNSIYNDKTKQNLKIGTVIESDGTYIKESINNLLIDAYITMLNYSKTLNKEECKVYTNTIFNISFELMCKGEWNVAMILFNNIMNNSIIENELKTLSLINYWICKFKLSNNYENYSQEFKKIDFSDKSDYLKLGYYSLLMDKDEIENIIRDNNEIITKRMLKNWPVFFRIREEEDFYNRILSLLEEKK